MSIQPNGNIRCILRNGSNLHENIAGRVGDLNEHFDHLEALIAVYVAPSSTPPTRRFVEIVSKQQLSARALSKRESVEKRPRHEQCQ